MLAELIEVEARLMFENDDQLDASKAGDLFAKFENAALRNGNCFFKDRATDSTLKPRRPKPTGLEA